MNYKAADLAPKQRAMLDFAALLTTASATVESRIVKHYGTMASMTVTFGISPASQHSSI